MPDPAVVNASPLILLAKAARLELLRALGSLAPSGNAPEIGPRMVNLRVIRVIRGVPSRELGTLQLYVKRFGRERPEVVISVEERARAKDAKRAVRKEAKRRARAEAHGTSAGGAS